MKSKINSIVPLILTVVVSIGATSCHKETRVEEEEGQKLEITASFDDGSTKTQLSKNGYNILWSPNDSITVFYGEFILRANSLSSVPCARTIFQTEQSIIFAPMENDSTYIYACCPYSPDAKCQGDCIQMSIPSSYRAVAGTFQPGTFPSVARSYDNTMRFYNVCGGFAFKVHHDNIESITVTALDDNVSLAGPAGITFGEDGIPVAEAIPGAQACSTLTLSMENGCFIKDSTYYLPSLPAKINEGLKICYYTQSTSADTTLSGGEIKRATFAKMFHLDKDLDFTVDVKSVTLNENNIVLAPSEAKQLIAEIKPEDASDKRIYWSTSDKEIADVDGNGNVTASDTSGICMIYAVSVQSPTVMDSCRVEVLKNVKSVKISPDSVTVYKNDTYSLAVEVLPAGATDPTVSWISSDNNVATVSSDGLISAISKGECLIFAVSNENEKIKDSCYVKVVNNVESITLDITEKDLFNGDSFQVTAKTLPEDALDPTLEWTSENEEIATVSENGLVKGVGYGSCKITAASKTNPEVSASFMVTVIKARDLNVNGTANCYIADAPGYYKFRGDIGGLSKSLSNPSQVSVLWECKNINDATQTGEIVSKAIFRKDSVFFKIPDPMLNGNAVIAVKNNAGEILWSWHIWAVKDYDPDKCAVRYRNNAGTVMDRNVGSCCIEKGNYSSTGMLYQWGRKDPFPPRMYKRLEVITTSTDWPIVQSTTTTGTIEYSILNPLTFITKNSINKDWYWSASSTGAKKDRWDEKKTDYDPCPVGWKVPKGDKTNGLWTKACGSSSEISIKWDFTNYGTDLTGILTEEGTECWYCGTGGYSSADRSVDDIGSSTYLWSSTSPAGKSYCFLFYATGVGEDLAMPAFSTDCAYGYAVRCVKDD